MVHVAIVRRDIQGAAQQSLSRVFPPPGAVEVGEIDVGRDVGRLQLQRPLISRLRLLQLAACGVEPAQLEAPLDSVDVAPLDLLVFGERQVDVVSGMFMLRK